MNRAMKTITLALALLLTTAPAMAGNIGKRQVAQQKRIHQGVRSGELTRGETRRLVKQQIRIQRSKRQARSDGKVTRRERARIHHQQNRASRNIFRQKHDRQAR